MAGKKGRSGRKPSATGYRAWCREVADRDDIRAAILGKAQQDPDFALKVAEHGYGRPPQALDVSTPKPFMTYLVAAPGAIPPVGTEE